MTMLEIHDLCVRYDRTTAVQGFNLTLGAGEIVTLVGPTGCGKTSVLRTVAGLVAPAAGRIQLGKWTIDPGHDVPPEKRNVGLVFQDFALFPHYDVYRNITFRCRNRALAEHWMERMGLGEFRHALPATLSGGQKQRVALARALAHEPALMLLDEPLASLDAALKNQLRWQIRDALKDAGVPALWVTHDQAEALSVGDRMGVMRAGRLEQLDAPDTCFGYPANRFVAAFLGEAAFVPGTVRDGHVHTPIGDAPAASNGTTAGAQTVDVMVRPNDLALTPAAPGNSRIERCHYEGETRLYTVRLLASGQQLQVRTDHTQRVACGATVDTRISAGHPLALFAA